MLGRTDSRPRLLVLLAFVVALSGGLMLRLAYWQVVQRQELVAAAQQNGTIRDVNPPMRGTIYDRTGRVVLAQTIYRDRLIGAPAELTEKQQANVASALATILGFNGAEAAKLTDAMKRPVYWEVLATDLDRATSAKIRDGMNKGTLLGLTLEPRAVRVYPQAGGAPGTSLASQLLGFVNGDGKGQYGVEQEYDALLGGQPEISIIDPSKPPDEAKSIVQKGIQGQDIRLTIDAGLQLALEQEVYGAWAADRAKRVSSVIMDPKSGALLAEASYPAYDANDYRAIASTNPGLFVDPVISQVYEPGSVFKMLLASAALKSGTTSLDTKINDFGVMRVPSGVEVADANRMSMGWMKFQDIVAWSRNVGVTQAAFKLGKDVASASKTLYSTWQSYGIGAPTGIDLAGEVNGLVRDPSKDPWRDIDLANASFGQGVAVTELQVLRAYVAMMNGGTLVRPHVASQAGQAPDDSKPGVIDSELSDKLTWLMSHVVASVPSYAKGALMPGYLVGGKTGTAQIWDPTANDGKGAWKQNIFNYSFYGYIGRNAPELAFGVVISEGKPLMVAQGMLPLAVESYQLFKRIATDSMSALAIQPVSKTSIIPASPSAMPSAPAASGSQNATPAPSGSGSAGNSRSSPPAPPGSTPAPSTRR